MNNHNRATPVDVSTLDEREFVLDVPILLQVQEGQAGPRRAPISMTLQIDRATGLVHDFELRLGTGRG